MARFTENRHPNLCGIAFELHLRMALDKMHSRSERVNLRRANCLTLVSQSQDPELLASKAGTNGLCGRFGWPGDVVGDMHSHAEKEAHYIVPPDKKLVNCYYDQERGKRDNDKLHRIGNSPPYE